MTPRMDTTETLKTLRKMIEDTNHGKAVHRYIELSKKLESPHFLDRLSVTSALWVQPIGHVIFWILFLFFPDIYTYLGGQKDPSMLTVGMYIVSGLRVIWTCLVTWCECLELSSLSMKIMIWKLMTIRMNVSPKIEIRSKDPYHQLYRWSSGASLLFDYIENVASKHVLEAVH